MHYIVVHSRKCAISYKAYENLSEICLLYGYWSLVFSVAVEVLVVTGGGAG